MARVAPALRKAYALSTQNPLWSVTQLRHFVAYRQTMSVFRKQLYENFGGVSSGIGFIYVDEQYKSIISIHNYWTRNYKIDQPEIQYQMFSGDGRLVQSGDFVLSNLATAILDSTDLLGRDCRSFSGIMVFSVKHAHVQPERYMQFNMDLVRRSDGVPVTGVHGMGLSNAEPSYEELMVPLLHTDASDIQLVLYNPFVRRLGEIPYRVTLSLGEGVNGDTREVVLKTSGQSCLVSIRELFGEKARQSPYLLIRHNAMYNRILYMVKQDQPNKSIEWEHASQRTFWHQPLGTPRAEFSRFIGSAIISVPALIRSAPRLCTRYRMINEVAPVPHGIRPAIKVFDRSGRCVDERKFAELKPGEPWSLDITDVIGEREFSGSAILYYEDDRLRWVPWQWSATVEFVGDGAPASAYVGSSLSNNRPPLSTYVFSRAWYVAGSITTWLCLCNHSSRVDYAASSATTIMVLDRSGQRKASARVSIPPFGAWSGRLEDLFSTDVLSSVFGEDRYGSIVVDDRRVNLSGFHALMQGEMPTSFDHFFGG